MNGMLVTFVEEGGKPEQGVVLTQYTEDGYSYFIIKMHDDSFAHVSCGCVTGVGKKKEEGE